MKKYTAIAGLVVVTVIWGGGFVASDMALDSLLPFQIMAIRFLLASVLMGGSRSFSGILSPDHRAAVYDSVEKCVSHGNECGDRPLYRFFDLPEKDRIQGHSRGSAGHSGGGSFVFG